ncbi:MAG: ribosome biogenesis GTPase YlqF [Eubacterium sp.]|nr:ribosome biogenesis GTPase YlqF [Oscillospiraceae bacterium]MDD6355112.1 ribosome biogenesis GTPase YlqF [Oscillospiraceae bacterium]MDY4607308.1 ribosome biogenesis GTPase YlqF [Eubacterium sp.]
MPDFVKQNVQWFPGHMAKTRRQIKESLKLVDGVVEIVDARIPVSSKNPELEDIIGNKPRIILLNKADVADPNATSLWLKYYEKKGYCSIAVDCRSGKGLNKFDDAVKKSLAPVISRNESKGMAGKPLRLMVVGIPNTGKSSFINRMSKSSKAKVADKAGVTRQNQWFNAGNGIELLDTPGVLWPKFDDPEVGDKLAFIGSVKDEVTDKETLVCRLLESLAVTRPSAIEERYKLESVKGLQGWEIMEMIGRKRGFLIKGGEIDYDRTAAIVSDEFRGGKLGRITLELP